MEQQKPKYIMCPRCELNYFAATDSSRKYCDVCLAELNLVDPGILIPDEDSELEILCPVCKVNYMSSDEEMCFLCFKEQNDKVEKEDESIDAWGSYLEAEEPLDNDMEISLSEIDEQEEFEDEAFDDNTDTMGEGFEEDFEQPNFDDTDWEDEEDEDDEEGDDF